MSESLFKTICLLLAVGFTTVFVIVVVPPLMANFDVFGAFAAGFVNPYASGYSTDVFFCWAILAVWVVYEAKSVGVRHGWWCLLLGVVPGVAVGFALYLVVRLRQVETRRLSTKAHY